MVLVREKAIDGALIVCPGNHAKFAEVGSCLLVSGGDHAINDGFWDVLLLDH